MAATNTKQDFKLHDNHVDMTAENPIPHNTNGVIECGICEVRTIVNDGIRELIEKAYGPQNG